MNASGIISNSGRALARHASECCQAAVLVVLVGVSWSMAMAICQAPEPSQPASEKKLTPAGAL